jgi:hypothetical protein
LAVCHENDSIRRLRIVAEFANSTSPHRSICLSERAVQIAR